MRLIFITFFLAITQLLSSQSFTIVDELASFPGCEAITDNTQKQSCNQTKFQELAKVTGMPTRIELMIDANGCINSWQLLDSSDSDVLERVDLIMNNMRWSTRLSPPRIGTRYVNGVMIMLMPVLNERIK